MAKAGEHFTDKVLNIVKDLLRRTRNQDGVTTSDILTELEIIEGTLPVSMIVDTRNRISAALQYLIRRGDIFIVCKEGAKNIYKLLPPKISQPPSPPHYFDGVDSIRAFEQKRGGSELSMGEKKTGGNNGEEMGTVKVGESIVKLILDLKQKVLDLNAEVKELVDENTEHIRTIHSLKERICQLNSAGPKTKSINLHEVQGLLYSKTKGGGNGDVQKEGD